MKVFFVLKIFICVQFVSPYILQHPSEKLESDLIFDEEDVNSIRNHLRINGEKSDVDDSTRSSKNEIRPRRATRNWGESEDEDSFSDEYETYDAKSDSGRKIESLGPSKSKNIPSNYMSNSINHFHDHTAPAAPKKSLVSDSDDEDLVGPGSGAGTDQDERTYVAPPTSSTNTNTKCNANEFRCHVSGRCIDLQLRCDWIPDCGPDDNSDELNCAQNIICPSDQFACEGGSKCIPLSARCDGHYDCADFSDEDCGNGKGPFLELKPHPALQTVRQGNEVVFQCRDESLRRAHVRWARGNGLPLPPGSRDDNGRLEIPNVALDDTGTFVCEAIDYPASTPGARASVYLRVESNQLRPPTACAAHEATCTNGECIDKSMVCDGDKDCSDGSDEIRCGKRDDCEPNELRCSNKRCIPKTWRCDGDNDCGDNTDELSCTPPPPGSPCRYDEFTCTSRNQCVSKMFHCDKENDCTDHSDEVGCSKPVIQRPPLPLVTLNAGDVFNISCSALGNPMPEIVWRLNWGHIPDKCTTSSVNGQGVLTCPKIELTDQGAYSCESINSLGSTFAIPDCILVVKSTSAVCSPGTFNDFATTPEECTPCFCFGHSSTCDSSGLYLAELEHPGNDFGLVGVSQDLRTGKVKIQDGDSGTNLPSVVLRTVGPNNVHASSLNTKGTGIVTDVIPYVNLSPSYSGNLLKSYSGNLRYTLKFRAQGDYLYAPDVIISGNNVTLVWFGGEMGTDQEHTMNIRYWPGKWYKRMHVRPGSTTVEGIHAASREEIMQVLANVEYILIRTQYDEGSPLETTISGIRMETATVSNSGLGQAIHVEKCRCPPGYSGLSCNECAPGYERKHSGPWLGICTRTASEYKELSCPEGYYFELGQCKVCPCPGYGKSFGKSCFKDDDGEVTCNCVEGHAGRTCQQCSRGYVPNPVYPHDCRLSAAQCDVSGSIPGVFDHKTGHCICKDQATGPLCNECKPTAFHLSKDNLHGCTSCFCMGITSQCSSSKWYRTQETTNFVQNSYGFTLVDEAKRNVIRDGYSVDQSTRELGFKEFHRYLPEIYYWQLPYNFLGDKITSYGGYLNYTVRYIPAPGGQNSLNSAADVEIRGNNVTLLYFNKLPVPANSRETMSVPLLEQYWQRQDGQLASRELLLMALANLDVLLIKATYTTSTREAHISDVILDYAVSHNTGQDLAHTVEQCACPQGYMGLSCQECAFGYTRILRGMYLGHCVPCFCNGYSNECNPKTGVCQNCRGNTTGDLCEQCDKGYMADPRTGGCILEIGPVPLQDANCTCDARGSHRPGCPDGRNCLCKGNVEGRTCSLCRPSTFALQEDNPQGCLQCYCSRVSTECSSATLFRHSIDSEMIPEIQGFTLTNGNGKSLKDIAVSQNSEESAMRHSGSSKSERWFWSLPSKFTGNRITSYGGKLRAIRMYYIRPGGGSRKVVQGDLLIVTEDIDVLLVGNNGVSLFRALNDSVLPGQEVRLEVPLKEAAGWRHLEGSSNPAHREDIMEVLSDLKAILIRASFTDGMVAASINSVSLEDAVRQYTPNGMVMEVEECQCPVGYEGLSCESCSVGYYRIPKDHSRGVPGGSCQVCPCSHNSESCRLEFGRPVCICRAGFSGPKCEVRAGEPSTILLPQVSISGPTLQTVPVGGSVTFRCEGASQNGAGVKVIWSKENGAISARARDNGFGVLTFNEVLPSDSGTYLCSATDDYGFTVETVVLTIIEEESFYNFPTPPKVSVRPLNLTVQRGYQARISCTAIGNPTPSISWTRGRTGMLPPHVSIENGDLIIPSTRKSDEAEYFCTARNPAGIDTGSASLRIKEEDVVPIIIPPSTDFTVTVTPSNYETRPGKIVHFRCTSSENNTRIEWTKLSEPLPLSATQSLDGSLNIFFVRDSDSGIYICTATSSSGKTIESQVSLAVFQTSTPPHARIEPERQTVEEGKQLEINCIISGDPTPTIEWTKVGSFLPSSLSPTDEFLRIPSAQVSDRGVYVCTVENSAGKASASAIVEVDRREEPQIDIYPSPRQTIIQNGSALFQCRVLAGIPPPVVSWSRANGQLMPANVEEIQSGVLQFNGVTGDEEGQYRCNAVSEAGSATAIATLVIQYPPKVFITPNTSLRARKGESVRLQCRAEGDPPPSVTWKRLQNTQDDWIELPSAALSSPQMPLFEIQNIVKSDEGYYSCVASNDVGVDQEVLQLLVEELSEPLYSTVPQSSSQTKDEEIPRILEGSRTISNCIQSPPRIVVQPVRQFVRVGDVVRFECLASGDLPIATSWSRVDRKPLPFHAVLSGSQLMFRGIQVSDAGRYACLARNSGGTAESVAEVVVNSEDGPPIPRPQLTVSEKTGYAGSSIDLFCLSTTDIVTWTKEGAESLPRTAIPLGSRLKFIDLQISDSGRYVCETEEGSEIVVLTVEAAPSAVRFRPSGVQIQVSIPEVVVETGSSVTFRCQGNFPQNGVQVRMLWSKENDVLPTERAHDIGSGLLAIEKVQPSDSGTYVCTVTDGYTLSTDRIMLAVSEEKNNDCIKTSFGEADVEVLQSSMELESLLSRESRNNVVNSLLRFYYRIEDLIEENVKSDQVLEKAAKEGSIFTESDSELLQSATSTKTIISQDGLKQIVNLLTRIYYFIRSIVNEVLGNLEALRKQATEMETMFTEGDLKMIQSVRDSENIFSREGVTSLLNLVMRSYFFMGEIIENELDKVGKIGGDTANLEDMLNEAYDLFGSASSSENVLSRHSLSKFINFLLRMLDVVLDEVRGTESNGTLGIGGAENIQDNDDNATNLQSETEFERIFSRKGFSKVSALTVKIFNFLRQIFEKHCQEIVDVSNMQNCKSTTIIYENSTAETVTATTVESDRNATNLESTDRKGMTVTTSKGQPTKEIESDSSSSREIGENVAKGVNETTAVEEHETVQETKIEDSGEVHTQGAKSQGAEENVEHTEIIIEEETEETVNQSGKGSKVKGQGAVNETVGIAGGVFGGENITEYEYYDEVIQNGKVVKNRTKVTTGTVTNVTVVQNQVDEQIEEYDYEETNLDEESKGISKGVRKAQKVKGKGNVTGTAGSLGVSVKNNSGAFEETVYYDEETRRIKSGHGGNKNITQQLDLDFPDAFEEEEETEEVIYTKGASRKKSKGPEGVNQTVEVSGGAFQGAGGNVTDIVYYDEESEGETQHGRRIVRKRTKHVNVTKTIVPNVPSVKNQVEKVFNFDGGSGGEDTEHTEVVEEESYEISGNGTTKRTRIIGHGGGHTSVTIAEKASGGGGANGNTGHVENIEYYDEEIEESQNGHTVVKNKRKKGSTKNSQGSIGEVHEETISESGAKKNIKGQSVVNGTTKAGENVVKGVVGGSGGIAQEYEYDDEDIVENLDGQRVSKKKRKNNSATNSPDVIYEDSDEIIYENPARKKSKGRHNVNHPVIVDGEVEGLAQGNNGENIEQTDYYDEEIEEISHGSHTVKKTSRKKGTSEGAVTKVSEVKSTVQNVGTGVGANVQGNVDQVVEYYDEETEPVTSTVVKTTTQRVTGSYPDIQNKIEELTRERLGKGAKVTHQSAFHTTAGVTVGGGQIPDDNDQYVEVSEVSEETQQDEAIIAGGKNRGYVLGEFRSFGGDLAQNRNNGEPEDPEVVQENGPALLQTEAPFEGISFGNILILCVLIVVLIVVAKVVFMFFKEQ